MTYLTRKPWAIRQLMNRNMYIRSRIKSLSTNMKIYKTKHHRLQLCMHAYTHTRAHAHTHTCIQVHNTFTFISIVIIKTVINKKINCLMYQVSHNINWDNPIIFIDSRILVCFSETSSYTTSCNTYLAIIMDHSSRDHEAVGMAHENDFTQNQPKFPQTTMGQHLINLKCCKEFI